MAIGAATVLGSGFVVGEHCVKNEALARIMTTSDEWIRERSGIEQRYFVNEGTTTSDLAVAAARKAMEGARVSGDEIDYIVAATMTPDHYFPGIGGTVATKLGLKNIPALDLRQQCSGFIYGMQVADALLRTGAARRILFLGAEIHGGFFPWSRTAWDNILGKSTDPISSEERALNDKFRGLTVLFGDAAAAMVLGPSERADRGLLGTVAHSDGSKLESLFVPSGGFAYRPYFSDAHFAEARYVPHMDGRTVFKMAVTKMPEAVLEVCEKAGVKLSEVDLLIPHQANLRISESVQKTLGLPNDRVYNNIQRYGNTTAATIPIAYDECKKSGRIQKGNLICFVGLGAGFHWGASLMREP